MMRTVLVIVIFLLSAMPSRAEDADSPIVVELFTSQGCSSCPPADEFLGQLKVRQDLILLAFHVDYWDSLGWKDPYSLHDSTQRQKNYSQKMGKMYTPQMIINGDAVEVGSNRERVFNAIKEQKRYHNPVQVSIVQGANGKLDISLQPDGKFRQQGLDVWLVRYDSHSENDIESGENSGLRFINNNPVRSIQRLASWDGRPASFQADDQGENVAVLVQEANYGRIVGAQKLDRQR